MPPRRRVLPNPLPEGFLLTDTEKKTWRLGKVIGQGGFGLIYLASQNVDRHVAEDSDFVIKVEFQENGPLFSELKFYQRAAKPDVVQKWMVSRKLDYMGIPRYWGSGLAEHNGTSYRFMVMDRLGIDLQKVCSRNGGRLRKTTVLYLAQTMLNVLEYIHDNEYVHADIKLANLMLGHRDPEHVYLADYGLAYRYCPQGTHKEYKENPKKGHDGTIEYTSLDAHNGVAPSRRGDLQVLGFCLLHCLCGSLPWDSCLKNPTQVQETKARLMEMLPGSVTRMSVSGASTDEVASLLLYVKSLDYKERPDYKKLRELLASGGQGRLDLSGPREAEGGSSTRMLNPRAGDKKADQARGPSKAGDGRPKAPDARYLRGPPIGRPQVGIQAPETPVQSTGIATRRSPRTRGQPIYVEPDEEEEEEEHGKKASEYKWRPVKKLDVAFANEQVKPRKPGTSGSGRPRLWGRADGRSWCPDQCDGGGGVEDKVKGHTSKREAHGGVWRNVTVFLVSMIFLGAVVAMVPRP